MNTKSNSLPSPSGKWFIAGLLAMTVLTTRLHAQYVTTIISNGLAAPYGVAVDSSFNLYIANTYSNCILKYVPSTKTVSVLAGQDGSPGGTANGTGTVAQFNQPMGLVFARGGLVVVDQYNQQLRYVSLAGAVSNLAGQTGVIGSSDGPALGGAQFCNPAGIAVAPDGQTLYIADQGNNSIRKLSSNNVVSTVVTSYTQNGVSHNFKSPAAVAVDTSGNLWIADSYNHVICVVTNGTSTAYGVAGTYRTHGTSDGPASTALFYLPSGLMWDSTSNVLVISDTDNATIRALYATNSSYAVETLSGLPGIHGNVDGSLTTAEFGQPFGLCPDPTDSGYYVGDVGNNSVRILQPTQPPAPPQPIPAPIIGYVTFTQINSEPSAQFNPFTAPVSVFNNDIHLSIEQLDGTVETYYNYGPTGSTIAPPGPSTYTMSPTFTQLDIGQTTAPTIDIATNPIVTIEAISEAAGRPSSPAVSAEIQFVTANPVIIGNDAADIVLSNSTYGAQMYYALDNSTNQPTNDGSYGIGPVTSGQTLTLNITSNVNLKVRAFRSNYAPSGTVTNALTVSNFVGNQLTFGFASGQGSSQFLGAAGRHFYAPVTITELPGTTMYSLQFNLSETNNSPSPQVTTAWEFDSWLRTPVIINGATFLAQIPPGIVTTNGVVTSLFTNDNLLGVSWIEIYPETNLYPTTTQDLTAISLAHDYEFLESSGKVLVGSFAFQIPNSAALGDTYTIQAGRPSATTYNLPSTAPQGVFMQAPTNGSLGAGTINAIKNVTVTNVQYLVGDAYPFFWFNAGDFGDFDLENDDVIEVFQSAVYDIGTPPTNSDFFDAMDSASGNYNLYDTGDTAINTMSQIGDGKLDVNDVYVTLKRSLDTNLMWFTRSWNGGVETVTPFTNFVNYGGGLVASTNWQNTNQQGTPRPITIAADQVNTAGGLSVQVPVRVIAPDPLYPLRVLMLSVQVEPLDGSPPIANAISFNTADNLGSPYVSASQSANNFSAAWLDSTVSGVSGSNIIGTFSITLPPNATSNSAYLVHFTHFSASPNGIALFAPAVQDGLITLSDRSGSSWHDGIPDSWRLLWFGSVYNSASAATADPDGDGANNYQEYVAGTNPNDPASVFQFLPGSSRGPSTFTLQWPSVVNKHYSVQASYTMFPGKWSTIATNIVGTGQSIQWTDNNAAGKTQFYRAIVQ